MKYSGTPLFDFLVGKNKKVTINLNDNVSIKKSMSLLDSVDKDIKQALYDEVERLCQIGEDKAKSMVHVDSGELQTSIKHTVKVQKKKIKGTVTAGTDHAMFQEFGTGVIGKGTYPGDDGGWVYDYRNQNWQGHKSNHFMYDAAREMERAMKDGN